MWDLVARNIWQRRLRSLLTVLGIAVAVQVYLTVSGILSSYQADLQDQLATLAGRVFVQRPMADGSGMEEFPSAASSIDAEPADRLLALEGVNRSVSSAILYLPLASPPMAGLPPASCAIGIEPGHEAAFLGDLQIVAGRAGLDGPRSVILGQAAAEQRGGEGGPPAAPGDTIDLLGTSFTVAGVLESAPGLFDGMVMMDLASAQALFERPGSVTAVVLTPDSVEGIPSIRAAVAAVDARLETGVQEEIVAAAVEMTSISDDYTGMIKSTVVAVIFLFVTIVMIVAVMEQQREIGILRAIGARRMVIFGMVALESLALSVAGALLAWPIWGLLSALLVGGLTSDGPVMLSAWAEMALLALFVGVVASILPAWRAVRVDPLESLQY
jgi:ABC-type lipoprotein release transport system permease subunit